MALLIVLLVSPLLLLGKNKALDTRARQGFSHSSRPREDLLSD
jgi:hypothetical protein